MELNSSSFVYKSFTKERFNSILDSLLSKYNHMNTGFVVYTNLLGKIAMDISFERSWFNFPNTYIERVRKGKYSAVIHLVSKSGLLKAYYNYKNDNFEVKDGTKLLFISNSIGACTFQSLGFDVTFKDNNKKYPIKELKEEDLEWKLTIE